MPDEIGREQSSPLDRERSNADDNLRLERDVLDATLEAISHEPQADGSIRAIHRDLRERIERQRRRFDDVQRRDRGVTDDLIREHRDADRANEAQSAQSLWRILAELDALATTAQAIAEMAEGERPIDLPSIARAIQTATDRILTLAGDILDPQDQRGIHHELGGSG